MYENKDSSFQLYQILEDNECTVIKLTPAHLLLIANEKYACSNLKKFIVGGDNLSTYLAKKIQTQFGPRLEIYNEYGPTETVVGCMIHKYDMHIENIGAVSIGKPIDNMQIYLLNEHLKSVPLHVPGEIYIAGVGVARGYLNNEEETAKCFVPNPFKKNDVMYRSGDIGVFVGPGNMKYVSRKDNQVKINGFRIELAEIELCIVGYLGIDEAVVLKHENEKTNFTSLSAYYTANEQVDKQKLKEYCERKLPRYMCPSVFIQLEEFPLTPNGKINKRALSKIKGESKQIDASEELDKMQILKNVISAILSKEDLTMESNYFYLGGDSITAIQVSAELLEHGIVLNAKDILLHPVLNEMVPFMSVVKKVQESYKCSSGTIGKTPIIKWFEVNDFENKEYYNLSFMLALKQKDIKVDTLKRILRELIHCHEALRINYSKEEHKLFYNEKHLEPEIVIKQYDLSGLSQKESLSKVNEISWQLKASFDLERSLLIKTCLLREYNGQTVWYFTFHHLVVDGVSLHILMNDINSLLEKEELKQDLFLPREAVSYQMWAEYLEQHRLDAQKEFEYWRKECECNYRFPYLEQNNCEDEIVSIRQVVEKIKIEDLLSNANQFCHSSTEDLLVTAFIRTLYHEHPSNEILIEMENNGRDLKRIDVARTVGWFTSFYPVKFHIRNDEIDELLRNVKEKLREVSKVGRSYGLLEENGGLFTQKPTIKFNYLGQIFFETDYVELLFPMFDDDWDRKNVSNYDLEVNVLIFNEKFNPPAMLGRIV